MQRIQKEFLDTKNIVQLKQITYQKISDRQWKVTFQGPIGSSYEGGTFTALFNFPQDYPVKPPEIIFKTQIYHLNFKENEKVRLGILQQDWSSYLNVSKILLVFLNAFKQPQPYYPIDEDLLKLFEDDQEQFKRKAQVWTEQLLNVKLTIEYKQQDVVELNKSFEESLQQKMRNQIEKSNSQFQMQSNFKDNKESQIEENYKPANQKVYFESNKLLNDKYVEPKMETIMELCLKELQEIIKQYKQLQIELNSTKSEEMKSIIASQIVDLAGIRKMVWKKYHEIRLKTLNKKLKLNLISIN